MANQLREWIQSLVTAVGNKSGRYSGTINAGNLEQEINNLPDTTELRTLIGRFVENEKTDIVIPNGPTFVGSKAFYYSSATSITLPDSVTRIDANAFDSCQNITSFTIPNNVTSLGNQSFRNCTNLKNITIGKNIITFGNSIFSSCNSLESVVFEEGTESFTLGTSTFSGCKNLKSVVLPNNLTELPKSTFYQCTKLQSVNLPNELVTIGDDVFNECNALQNITFSSKITSIGNSAFKRCYAFTEITIPETITNFGEYVFQGCSGLTKVNLPNNITILPYGMLSACTALKDIKIPNSVTTIKNGFVSGCSSLTTLKIPASVTSIENYGLNCGSTTNKTTFIFESLLPPTIQSNTFTPSNINRIYLTNPDVNIDTWKTATNWSSIASYIFLPNTITFNIDSSLLNNENVLYSIDNAEEQQFTQASFTGENLATLKVTSKTADITVLVGTTQGGSEIGTVANASTVFTFESDTTIYITKQ